MRRPVPAKRATSTSSPAAHAAGERRAAWPPCRRSSWFGWRSAAIAATGLVGWRRAYDDSEWPGPSSKSTSGPSASTVAQAVGEAHGVAQVVDPVLRVGRLLGGDPRAGQVGEVRAARRRQLDRCARPRGTRAGSGRASSCARRRRAGSGSATISSVGERGLQRGDVVGRSGDDALVVGVDRGQRQRRRQHGAHLGLGQRDGQHRRAGAADPVDQRGPG